MARPRHVDPDHFLETDAGRVWSEERGQQAWVEAYRKLEQLLGEHGRRATLYVVCGLQGAGKTHWVEQQYAARGPHAIFFDAALPSRRHRERALALARGAGARAVAVFIDAPLQRAMMRNAQRGGDYRVPDATVLHVHAQLVPPSVEEGFDEVILVAAD